MAGIVVAEGVVEVTADGRPAAKKVVDDFEKVDGKRAGDGIGRKVFGGVLGAWAAIGGAQTIVGFFQGAIGGASDLNETMSKSEAIFGKSASAISSWGDTAPQKLGLAKEAAVGAAASFGDMFLQIGFTEDAATKMSTQVVQAAADLGSFSNLDTADVAERISAAFRGEYDSLQMVIPNINAARVESEALAMTQKKAAKELTAAEKAAAVLAIVQKDGARAMGDFERTSTGAANATKIVRAEFEQQQAAIGTRLLPAWGRFLNLVGDGVPVIGSMANGLLDLFQILGTGAPREDNVFGWAKDDSAVIMLGKVRDGFIQAGKVAAPVFKGVLDAVAPLWPALGKVVEMLTLAVAQTGVSAWGIFLGIVESLTPIISGLAIGLGAVVDWLSQNQPLVNAVVIGLTAWTVAQWALNAALIANPIGIIVTAIGALVGGIIYVATQTTFFQDVWNGAMQVIGGAATWLWETIINPVFTFIGNAATWLWKSVIEPAMRGIFTVIGVVAGVITALWQAAVQPVFNAIGAIAQWLWQSVIKPVFDWIGRAVKSAGLVFQLLYNTYVRPVFTAVGNVIRSVWNNNIKPVFDFIGNTVRKVGDTIRGVFGGVGEFIGNAFRSALSVVRGPINGIIGLVNSAIRGINSLSVTIPDWVPMVGGQTWGANIPTIPYLARGSANAPDAFVAGERGPELIVGAGGSRVYPADQTRRKLDNDERSGVTIEKIEINEAEDPLGTVGRLRKEARKWGKG